MKEIDINEFDIHSLTKVGLSGDRALVYFLFSNGELVYVGQTMNVLKRIGQHKLDKSFDSFSVLDGVYDAGFMEVFLIKKFSPKYNNVCNDVSPYKKASIPCNYGMYSKWDSTTFSMFIYILTNRNGKYINLYPETVCERTGIDSRKVKSSIKRLIVDGVISKIWQNDFIVSPEYQK